MINYIIPIIIISIAIFLSIRLHINNKKNKQNMRIGTQYLANNKEQEGVIETMSGLQYQVLIPGEGTQHPDAKDTVKVHYHGTLVDGRVFDSSVERGQPISFALNQVIPGWTEGVQLMVVGEKTRFFVPAYLAYGKRAMGIIEPGSLLIFDVKLLGINE